MISLEKALQYLVGLGWMSITSSSLSIIYIILCESFNLHLCIFECIGCTTDKILKQTKLTYTGCFHTFGYYHMWQLLHF